MTDTGRVTSADGTSIGYRQLGRGPGIVLVHGAMQASQNFTRLAQELAEAFTIYVLDRRGRGLSGPYGPRHTIQHDCEDLDAVLRETGAHDVFALSAGALIALQTALTFPAIRRLALYEPPLPLSSSVTAWVPRYDQERAQGKLASAFVTAARGTETAAVLGLVPRFLLVPLIGLALEAEAKEVKGDDVPLRDLVQAVHFDAHHVVEMTGAIDETLERCKTLQAEVLLLGGSKSPKYLKSALDALSAVVPHARRVELRGVGHLAADNRGKPALVAAELRRFFGLPLDDRYAGPY